MCIMPGTEINSIENEILESEGAELQQIEPAEVEKKGIGIDLSFLQAKTGEGAIESYIDHPLNFNNSQGVARIIRGATGMLGALDLAIIDIALGILELWKGRKKIGNAGVSA